MQVALDHTHDPAAESWVEGANRPDADFPLQNLPFAVFRRRCSGAGFGIGVGIGDCVLDLAAIAGSFGPDAATALAAAQGDTLNGLMALGEPHWTVLRHMLFASLLRGSPAQAALQGSLVSLDDIEFGLPAIIGDFTDFYASIHHATAVGRMFRPQNPLLPNYKWLPVAYHGRSSSIGISGHRIVRPAGQSRLGDAATPSFEPSLLLDYELELGFFIGPGNVLGHPVPIGAAEAHVFGACVLNDWSARDIQTWEYQPLGPFLGKNFATTLSPWVITLAALAPFRSPCTRDPADPAPLPHLDLGADAATGAIDVRLEVALQSAAMRDAGLAPHLLAHSNYRHAYWTFQQMVAHHTSNGCNLRPGDLLGTGTLSGPGDAETGSLLEASRGGERPLVLPSGELRCFIEDGDSVVMRAWCERTGARRIGFGTCVGTVLPLAAPVQASPDLA